MWSMVCFFSVCCGGRITLGSFFISSTIQVKYALYIIQTYWSISSLLRNPPTINVSFKDSMKVSNHYCFCRTFSQPEFVITVSSAGFYFIDTAFSIWFSFYSFISLTFQSLNFCRSPLVKPPSKEQLEDRCLQDICSVLSQGPDEMLGCSCEVVFSPALFKDSAHVEIHWPVTSRCKKVIVCHLDKEQAAGGSTVNN